MTLSNVLEIGLGLILVYYVTSAIVTAITDRITNFIKLASSNLSEGLKYMLGDTDLYQHFYNSELIQSLGKQRITLFGVRAQGIDFIPNETFAVALFDALAPGIKANDDDALAKLRDAVQALPANSKARDTLMTLLTSGENSIEKAQARVAAWFDGVMNSVGDLYGQRVQTIVWIVALAVTLGLGIDSIRIARTLWEQPTVRAAAAAEANSLAQQGKLDLQNAEQVNSLLSQIEALNIPLTWYSGPLPTTPGDWGLKVLGLLITWIAAAQGAPFWYDVLQKLKPA